MLDSHKVFLYDRIKETSFTLGTSNFTLNGAADGFSSFGSVYSNGENVFYAATDGAFYEVGSGVYVTGVQNSLTRFPFRSSNNNQIVSFVLSMFMCFIAYAVFAQLSELDLLGKYDYLLEWIGIDYHYNSISRGVLDTRDVVYFFSFIALFLGLTQLAFGRRKW